MKRVIVVGELNVDLVMQGYHAFPALGREVLVDDFLMTLGSASAIAAAGLAKLGTSVTFYSKIGTDPWAGHCLESLVEAGVDVSRVVRDDSLKTGVTVSISSSVDRALVTFLGSIVALGPADVANLPLAGFDHLHVSSYFLQARLRPALPDLFRRAATGGLTTSLDPGFDPDESWQGLRECLADVDLFLPNEVELQGVTGLETPDDGLRALRNGRTVTVVKLGAEGCAMLEGDSVLRVSAPVVDPVDTTGAGDSFNAGFLDAWLMGEVSASCLRAAAFCGATSTRTVGGSAGQATREERDDYMRRSSGG